KALINAVDETGNSPLHMAVIALSVPIAKILIERGADPKLVNKEGKAPLHLAIKTDELDLVRLLLQVADSNQQDAEGNTALHLAAQEDNLDIVKLLIQNNARKDLRNHRHLNPYEVAQRWNKITLLEYLMPVESTIALF